MTLKIFLVIAIYTGSVFSSSYVPHNPKKINGEGEYQPYYGYTIISRIDTELGDVTKRIEKFIQSSLSKSYAPLPADTYHTSIYTIYSGGNKPIPPVARWANETGQTIPVHSFLPEEVLMHQNSEAMRILKKNVGEPLQMKRATLTVGKTVLSLTVELEEESLQRIENVRKELVKVYEHPNLSLEPIGEKLHITLAYAYGKKKKIDEDTWDELQELVRPLNTAKLMPPSVYLFESMVKYHPFQKVDESETVKKAVSKSESNNRPSAGVPLHSTEFQLCLFVVSVRLLGFIFN